MRRMAAARRGVKRGIQNRSISGAILTSISHLAGVTTCTFVAEGCESGADFAK